MIGIGIRGFAYLLLGVLAAEVLRIEANTLEVGRRFSEYGYVEWLQALLLALMVVLLLIPARLRSGLPELAVCAAGAFAFLFIRENDHFLELFLPHGIWKYPAGLVFLLTAVYAWKRRELVASQIKTWASTPVFGLMTAGIVVLVFSRLFGRGSLWEFMMGEQFQRDIKNMAEEGTELLAMMLVFAGVVEWAFFTRKRVNND